MDHKGRSWITDPGSQSAEWRREATAGCINLTSASQSLAKPAEWRVDSDRYIFVIHLCGRVDKLEIVMERGPSGLFIPKDGDIWIIPAGHKYSAEAQGDQARFVEIQIGSDALSDRGIAGGVQIRDEFIHECAKQIAKLSKYAPRHGAKALLLRQVVMTVEYYLIEKYLNDIQRSYCRERFRFDRNEISSYIFKNLSEPISIGKISDHFSISSRHFSHIFKTNFGISPWKFIIRARLDKSVQMLKSTKLSITEIALASGFSSSSHFSSTFKNKYGMPPQDFRLFYRSV